MRSAEIITELLHKLTVPDGEHLYGVIGTYRRLETFARKLAQARTPDGIFFARPANLFQDILATLSHEELLKLMLDEAYDSISYARRLTHAFELFLHTKLGSQQILVLANLETFFAENINLNLLRTLAGPSDRILLLLPGHYLGDRLVLFHEIDAEGCSLPPNLIAGNHLWEITAA